jgi:hypothetical protein
MAGPNDAFHARFALLAAWPVASLLAAMSLGGILTDAYAREAPAWIAQAIGQDWFDLLIAAPWIAICGIAARRSYRWRILLAGAYGYVVYELFIYAFAIHFNAMFLLYCATLGMAAFALIALLGELRAEVREVDARGAHIGGAFLVGLGAVFALMWLAEDVPAVLANTPPASLVETGLLTNPVHAIDLSFVLPAHIVVGVLLWRRRDTGLLYAPVVLAFGIVMAASIGGMMLQIALAGGDAPVPVIAAMFTITVATAIVLVRVVTGTRASPVYSSAAPAS